MWNVGIISSSSSFEITLFMKLNGMMCKQKKPIQPKLSNSVENSSLPDSCLRETGKVEVLDVSVGYCISMSAEPSGDGETTEKIGDIVVADRSFLHNDIVAAVSNPCGLTCTVVKVDLTIDLKTPGGEIKMVVEVVDNVTISFDDGFKCKITRDDPECLMPISKNLLEDTQYPYHPGQRVQGGSSLVFKNARWLRGVWKNIRMEGTQEMDHLKMTVANIEVHRPNVLLVEKTVSRYAQEYLLAKEISLVLNIKKSLLGRIARCTGAQIVPSLENLTAPKVGHCELFHVDKLWRSMAVLHAVFAAYNSALETSFLADEGATLLELPFRSLITVALPNKQSSLDRAISTISGEANYDGFEDNKLNNSVTDGGLTMSTATGALLEYQWMREETPKEVCFRIKIEVWLEERIALFSRKKDCLGSQAEHFQHLLCKCFEYEPSSQPDVVDLRRCLNVPLMTKPFAFDLSVASNSLVHGAPKRKDLADSQGTTLQRGENELEVTQIARHGCGIPWNWSRIHQRQEGLEIDKNALNLIASKSDGSLQDAEMTLDE
eukprot:Gb_29449 [translate_table: standard]